VKKTIFMVILAIFTLSVSSLPVNAANKGVEVTINLEDLNDDTQNAVLDAIKKKKADAQKIAATTETVVEQLTENLTVDNFERIMKAITGAIGDACKTLNVEVNSFIQSPVGLLTAGLITYKVIGDDIKGIVFGILGWLASTSVLLYTFTRFHTAKKFKTYEEVAGKKVVKDIKYVPRYSWGGGDGSRFDNEKETVPYKMGSVAIHSFLFLLFSIIAMCWIA